MRGGSSGDVDNIIQDSVKGGTMERKPIYIGSDDFVKLLMGDITTLIRPFLSKN